QLAAGFNLLLFVSDPAGLKGQLTEELRGLASGPIPVGLLLVCPKKPLSQGRLPGRLLIDADGLVARRYDAREMTAYLVRPDQYVSARFRKFHLNSVRGALDRASGQALQPGRGGGPS
ncbi:MAG: FAD-dependent oxidoreductase, partial [Quisquiliibacterium sp.]